MNSLPADEHLLFLFCSLVNHPDCFILFFLCLSAALFNLLSNLCFFLLCLLTFLFMHLLFLLIRSSLSMLKIAVKHKLLIVHLYFLLFPLQQDLQVSKRNLRRDGKSLCNSFYLHLNWLLWMYIFVCVFVCSAARLQRCFCLTPRFSFVHMFLSNCSSFFYCLRNSSTFWESFFLLRIG